MRLSKGQIVNSRSRTTPCTSPYSLVAADFTGNGQMGLAVANFGDNNLSVFLGNGDGTFTPASSSPVAVGQSPIAIVAGDFTGSGRTGLATANLGDSTISVLLQQ